MQTIIPAITFSDAVSTRETELFQESQNQIHCRADRLFAKLMVAQWLAGIAAALWISPKTWISAASQTHWHVWAAIFLGGAITALPVFLAWKQPGRELTRHVIAIAQMLTSALLIHLTGGRIETHFHVFGSLAFLAFYRDWRVLLTATIVIAVDHMMRGIFWPQSVFGVLSTSPWRWMEHAGWALFEDAFLFISIRQSLRDLREVARRRAGMELEIRERKDAETALRDSDEKFHYLADNITDAFWILSPDLREMLYISPAFERIWGRSTESLHGNPQEWANFILPEDRERVVSSFAALTKDTPSLDIEHRIMRADGEMRWVQVRGFQVRNATNELVRLTGIATDITGRKLSEAALEKAHKELVKTSRQAGMAEVATGVLHNVGNVINSVNVASSCLADSLKKSKAANLSKVIALLREHETGLGVFLTSDPKGRQVMAYLTQLSEHLAVEQTVALKELAQLQKNIEHIKEVVTMQQSGAKGNGKPETLQVTDLVEEALRMDSGGQASLDIQVIKKFDPAPAISIEKHKVLQILINLVRNARQSCHEAGRAEKKLTLRVTKANERVCIAVGDNGVGISPENLARIFAHGFTTKKNGHGFGLHSSVLAAKELGGSLTVQSDGVGMGAAFTLELPLHPGGKNYEI